MALSIEAINFVVLVVVEALVSEILPCAFQSLLNGLSYHHSLFVVVNEMVVGQRGIVEEVNIDLGF
jgi:hypothetical protein